MFHQRKIFRDDSRKRNLKPLIYLSAIAIIKHIKAFDNTPICFHPGEI